MICLAMVLGFSLIEESESPSKRFRFEFGNEKEGSEVPVENWFVDSKESKRFRLKGLDFFTGQNHGSFDVLYRADERLCAVIHDGKWEPKAARLIDISKMTEYDLLPLLKKDGPALFEKVYGAKYRRAAKRLVFDYIFLEWDKWGRVKVAVQAEVPKENLFGEEQFLWYLWDEKQQKAILRKKS